MSPPVLLLKAVNRLEARLAAPVAAKLVFVSQVAVESNAEDEELDGLFGVMPSSVSLGVSNGVPWSPATI